ncbi:uncharacterized protein LOC110093119 [Dendrobium catenatum]|uniref:Uncharacterized protein n=1 Tax=Dendrobium catenatum TaxID=906689 RepID=A0A2I0X9V8_9ASPA|nr:uncharacterized protein LOC110093119 [Dendrobium catenatum]PKU84670.1 hypothetical protein MA16_Dca026303 [Dendrobium catenatum]
MGVWREGNGWCFCGGGRTERLMGSLLSCKGPAMASISSGAGRGDGTGFLIHPNLLLTTHGTLASVTAAEDVEIQLNQGRFPARLVPYRFFITSSVLDLTIVGLDAAVTKPNSQGHHPSYLKTCGNPSLGLGSAVYLLSYTDKKELVIGEGKVVVATDNLIKLFAEGRTWSPGSAGFDAQGNLALMICDPMKLASSPTGKSSSASSSSSLTCKGDSSMLFGIPIPIICDWLHQHWEGSLDELSKPKLPLIRLLSTGQKSEHSCSFSQRQIFKPEDQEDANISSSAHVTGKSKFQLGSSSSANVVAIGQGISTPEIYESPKITSGTIRRKETATVQLLDINFPPRAPRSIVLPKLLKQPLPEPNENIRYESKPENPSMEDDCCSEVQSCSSPLEVSELPNEGEGFSSGEETMYSAETMESRNIPSPPKEISKFNPVGRSQSCVNYSRWESSQRNTTKRREMLQNQHRMIPARKAQSYITHKSREYYSPTVSSSMKKRNGSDPPPIRSRKNVLQLSPRWMF